VRPKLAVDTVAPLDEAGFGLAAVAHGRTGMAAAAAA
jgi:hypothetical protein